ncbi:hypothetical protein ACI65C_005763 [Semiaphis heraclei]
MYVRWVGAGFCGKDLKKKTQTGSRQRFAAVAGRDLSGFSDCLTRVRGKSPRRQQCQVAWQRWTNRNSTLENVLGHVSDMVELINGEMPILSSPGGGGSTDFVRVGIDCTLSPLKPATATTGTLYNQQQQQQQQQQKLHQKTGIDVAENASEGSAAAAIKRVVCSPDLPVFTITPVVEEAAMIDSAKTAAAAVAAEPTILQSSHTATAVSDKSLQCNVCHKVFMQKNAFQNHLRSHVKDTTTDGPFQCNYCSKSFTVPARLTRHYRTHTGEKPYKCEYCDKPFSVKENLSVHRRIHTKERPYKCDVCERAFEHSGKLHRHMRIHTGERPHKCSFCDKTFIQSGQLVIHIRTHTGEKPYVCKTCDKGFTCSKQLKVHTRTHTGEKPYSCDICGKSFGYNHVLKLHQVSHYGEKVYKCTICNGTFTSKKTMESHIKSHSDNGGGGAASVATATANGVQVTGSAEAAAAAGALVITVQPSSKKDAASEGETSSSCGSDKENNKSSVATSAAVLLQLSDEPKRSNLLLQQSTAATAAVVMVREDDSGGVGKSDDDEDDEDEEDDDDVMVMGAADVDTELNKLCQYLYPRLPDRTVVSPVRYTAEDETAVEMPPVVSLTTVPSSPPPSQPSPPPTAQSNDRDHLSLPPRKRSKMILKSMESTAKKEAQCSRYSSESSAQEPISPSSNLQIGLTSTPVQETVNVSNVTQIASPILPEQSTSSISNYELSKNISENLEIRKNEIPTDNNIDFVTELPSTSNVESSYLENCNQTRSITFTSTPINSCKLIPKQLFKPSASIENDNITEVNNSLKDLEGRRFVNIKHIFESIKSIKHLGFDCTFSDLEFTNEIRKGFLSIFLFTCKVCSKKEKIYSENPSDNIININMAVVSAVVNTGQGYTQLEEFAATLNMPMMSNRKYQELHTSVFNYTHKIALEGMIEAGKEEARLAIERGLMYEKIQRDDEFWENSMKLKLEHFYLKHLLPSLIKEEILMTN